jgi:plastocyanin
MKGVRMRVMLGSASLLLFAAACGADSGDPGAGGTTDTGSMGESGGTETTGDDPGAGSLYGGDEEETTGPTGATDAGTGDADVSVSLNNYLFDPRTVRVARGDVVAVRNGNTKTPHTFTVVGEDVDLELGPLETESTTIDLSPGTYDLICRFHEELGMTGTLKVT